MVTNQQQQVAISKCKRNSETEVTRHSVNNYFSTKCLLCFYLALHGNNIYCQKRFAIKLSSQQYNMNAQRSTFRGILEACLIEDRGSRITWRMNYDSYDKMESFYATIRNWKESSTQRQHRLI